MHNSASSVLCLCMLTFHMNVSVVHSYLEHAGAVHDVSWNCTTFPPLSCNTPAL